MELTMIILGSLESTYVVDFLVVLIQLNFFARCYGSGATSEYRLKLEN